MLFADLRPPSLALLLAAGCGSAWQVRDIDGDGRSPAQGDCWDAVEGPPGSGLRGDQIHPGATETWYDGIDQDCAGDDDFDADGDGWVPEEDQLGRPTLGVPGSGRHVAAGDCWDAPPGTSDEAHAPLHDLPPLGPEEVHPAAGEDLPYDGIDRDCDGSDDFDADGDGHAAADVAQRDGGVGDDCDDADPAVNPSVPLELCNDIDDDCDTLVDGDDPDIDDETMRAWSPDLDGDGHGEAGALVESCSRLPDHVLGAGDDCDDTDAAVSPEASEVCNGRDDDCDSLVDDDDDSVDHAEGATEAWADVDGDGYGDPFGGDTWCEPPGWTVDNTLDCDDTDPDVHPGVTEQCDGVDNDCNGLTDDEDPDVDLSTSRSTWPDDDADGYGDPDEVAVIACTPPSGYVADDTDCDDDDGAVHPGATEGVGDGVDQDCDGTEVCQADADGDGYAESGGATVSSADLDCADAGEASAAAPATDCDDGEAAVNPGASEVCDDLDVDEDCDGLADDDDGSVDSASRTTWYEDGDGDGFGDAGRSQDLCEAPTGSVADDTDCDDGDAAVNPAAAEVCDAADVDEDCDGLADDADPDVDATTRVDWYADADADGYGDAASVTAACDAPSGTVADDTDCDDGDPAVSPAAAEVCDVDDVDEDCSGAADDDDAGVDPATFSSFYADVDGDGHGDAGAPSQACDAPSGSVSDDTDCDDTDPSVSPSAAEVCNDGVDNDCDASTVCALADASLGDAPLAWTGRAAGDLAGTTLAFVEDMDGGGVPDVLVGAPTAESPLGAVDVGEVCLALDVGSVADPNVAGATVSLSAADVCIQGEGADTELGWGLASADVDGDGATDLVLGAPETSGWGGGAWLVMGPLSGLSNAVTDVGVYHAGEAGQAGYAAATGDVDGDGTPDVVLGAPESNLVPGGADAGNGAVLLLDGADIGGAGFASASAVTWDGVSNKDATGFGLAVADVDGDGLADLAIGAPKADSSGTNDRGAVYLVAGPATAGGSLSAAASLLGPAAGDLLGSAVAAGTDVNADGYGDLLVGGPKGDPGAVGNDSGGAWLVLGAASVNATASGALSAWAVVPGVAGGDRLGTSVAFAGDLDADGTPDLVVGAPKNDDTATDAGATYLVLGPLSAGTVDMTAASVVALAGAAGQDAAGTAVAGGADVNADGYDDVLVGSPNADPGGSSNAGTAALVLGLGL